MGDPVSLVKNYMYVEDPAVLALVDECITSEELSEKVDALEKTIDKEVQV